MQELVKEMYPDDNREELRQHIYKVIRRLPKEAMHETAVKWGIIDKKGNKVICKDIFLFLECPRVFTKRKSFSSCNEKTSFCQGLYVPFHKRLLDMFSW